MINSVSDRTLKIILIWRKPENTIVRGNLMYGWFCISFFFKLFVHMKQPLCNGRHIVNIVNFKYTFMSVPPF